MSTVRMCDYMMPEGPCGTIFSEREAGWSTGTMTVVGDDGVMTTERADFCPEHSPSGSPKARRYPRFNARALAAPAPTAAPADASTGDWSRDWQPDTPTTSPSGPGA